MTTIHSPIAARRVRFEMDSPIRYPDRLIHLDAIVASVLAERAIDDADETAWSRACCAEDLPFAVEHAAGRWVYQASALMFDSETASFPIQMTRAADATMVADDKDDIWSFGARKGIGKLNMASGRYKGYDLRVPMQWVTQATAYFITPTDRLAEVEELLRAVTHIGAIRRNGHGRIVHTEIEEDPAAMTHWMHRMMPWPVDGRHMAPCVGRYRPPYWRGSLSTVWEPLALPEGCRAVASAPRD